MQAPRVRRYELFFQGQWRGIAARWCSGAPQCRCSAFNRRVLGRYSVLLAYLAGTLWNNRRRATISLPATIGPECVKHQIGVFISTLGDRADVSQTDQYHDVSRNS